LISKATASHYTWGDRCDGWHLVRSDGLSVIHERMPPHAAEVRHHHRAARQFFFVLSGIATMEHGDERVELRSGEGAEIAPGVSHRIRNESERDIEFLVVSAPSAQGDRVLDRGE
jgi:mannose-6-phosphate isomerase-like protein (cupin superfamily)